MLHPELTIIKKTGKATWKIKPEINQRNIFWNKLHAFKEINSKLNGYIHISIVYNRKREHIYLHKLIWFIVHNELSITIIDHINRDRSDNRINNLRSVAHSENQKNTSKLKNNKSGVTGVCWDGDRNKWRAQCGLNGKTKYLGLYSDISDAETVVRKFRSENGFTIDHGD